MSLTINIVISSATSLLTAIGFIYFRVRIYRLFFGPRVKAKGNIKIQRQDGSNKVYVVNIKRKVKRWVHPLESLDKLGYDLNEDVEQLSANKLDKYDEKNDINLTY